MSPFSYRIGLVLAGSLLLALSAIGNNAHATLITSIDPSGANMGPDIIPCHRYDGLQPQGTTSPAISTCETMSPDLGKFRASLADHGWLIQGGTNFGGTFDLLNRAAHPQLYIGQDPTYRFGSFVTATYDLSRIGFAGASQLVFNANVQWFSYAGENPNGFAINSFYITQRFNDGRVQLQYGFEELGNQFYGFSLGTNSTTSPAGVGSSIPYEVGFIFNKTAPEANFRLASPHKHFYERFGVTRSVDPKGPQADWDNNNFLGLKWHIPGAKALYINELGYQTDAAPQQSMMWLRQGVMYNESHFPDFHGGYANNNYAYYLVGDYQLLQTDATQPFRGFYVNAKADYAPPDRNVYAGDMGVTFYLLGPFSRPYDVVALGYTFDRLSRSFERMQQADGFTAVDYSRNYSLSYVYRVSRGVYLSNQLSYTVNPIPTPKQPPSLTWMSSLSFSY
ncbi:carbohydrate porin [Dyella nitratireducens]|uniref:carbohydrate porin n=1 Tax=Dyella nitratireducens TaxID=1849580 RepID=UPI0016640770|nr:carbohydrate porin [Dyella nitratireducens]